MEQRVEKQRFYTFAALTGVCHAECQLNGRTAFETRNTHWSGFPMAMAFMLVAFQTSEVEAVESLKAWLNGEQVESASKRRLF